MRKQLIFFENTNLVSLNCNFPNIEFLSYSIAPSGDQIFQIIEVYPDKFWWGASYFNLKLE